MSAFWIFGIILNVTLTALAIWWVVKQMRRRDDPSPAPPDSAQRRNDRPRD
jgi:hypothetical protein